MELNLIESILLLILVCAAIIDILQHRIPNLLSLGGIVVGISLRTWMSGVSGMLHALGGFAIGTGIFLPFYLLHGMGAGDVKLMGAVGTFLGPKLALLATGLSLGAGGILAIIILISRGGFKPLATRYLATIKCLFVTGKLNHIPPAPGEVATLKFPYASAIGIGTLGALWWIAAL
jgi:prepilin peptidase CpaA